MGTVTVIRLGADKYEPQPIPEIGKQYHIFDDGKIKPSRHAIIEVVDIIPFDKCKNDKLLDFWRQEVEDCDWLYATETDYFIKTNLDDDMGAYFVRTTEGGWFSLGFFGSRLDIDGRLYELMIKNYGDILEEE